MSRNWFITGTSSGIGRQLTEQLLARGDRVAATLRRPGALDDLRATYGDALWIGQVDVTDTVGLRSVVDAAFAALGRIDAVVSNAGYGAIGALEEFADAQIDRQIATNFTGSVQLARAVIPHLRAQGGGQFLQIASALGQTASPMTALYAATKWAVEGMCEGLAMEVGAFGIKVTIVEPGAIRTDFGSRSADAAAPMAVYDGTPVDRVRKMSADYPVRGDPVKMAAAIIRCVEGGEAPLRLLLGSDAWPRVTGVVQARLDAWHAQKDVAFSTDLAPAS
ncbi:SDR family oxidoreductase [Sphingomonas adhaesiva]|uniref:SDR family oxidoreductase n=1 Tax=Sphingomonas adhaesiva TaxID=28212 RepID=UPI002FF58B6F